MSSDREDVGDVTYVTNTLHALGLSVDKILSALQALQLDPKSRWKDIPKECPDHLVELIRKLGEENPDCELVLKGCSLLNSPNLTIKK